MEVLNQLYYGIRTGGGNHCCELEILDAGVTEQLTPVDDLVYWP